MWGKNEMKSIKERLEGPVAEQEKKEEEAAGADEALN